MATFGTFTLLYSVTEVFILPKIHQASFFRALLDLALPFMVAYLLLFYIIFGKGFTVQPEAVTDHFDQSVSATVLRNCPGKSGVALWPGMEFTVSSLASLTDSSTKIG